jgi:glycolate oxidase FAD binding subunit
MTGGTPAAAAARAVREVIADAAHSGTHLRLAGGGTWLDAGHPVHAGVTLSTSGMSGVVEYVPGDLVITVGAGTTLADIADTTAAYEQWLALEPFVSSEGLARATVGATIATASHGPLAGAYGRARDLVLGLSFVTGDGTPCSAGGRVVKNVAGFDLVRLMTGAFGTLGVITEVSLRLHAKPIVDETFAIVLDVPAAGESRMRALAQLVQQINTAPMLAVTSSLASLAVAAHALPGALHAAHDTPPASLLLLARAMGNPARVAALRSALSAFGTVYATSRDVWTTIRTMDVGDMTFRLSDAPLRTGNTLHALEQWVAATGVRAVRTLLDPMRGTARVSCDTTPPPAHGSVNALKQHTLSESLRSYTLPANARAERLPRVWWPQQRGAGHDEIAQRLRRRFDPAGILNTGIMGMDDESLGTVRGLPNA